MRQILAVISIMLKELVRKKDIYALVILMGIFLGIMSSHDIFGLSGISRHIVELGYTCAVIFSVVISATTGARQLPAEISSKTIYPLLAKPISRIKVVFTKFLGSFVVSSLAFTVLFLIFAFFYADLSQRVDYVLMLQSYVLGIMLMSLVSAVAIFFSNFMTFSANITLTLLLYAAGVNFSGLLRSAVISSCGPMSYINGVIYYLFPQFGFYDMRVRLVHYWPSLPLWVVSGVCLYTFLYSAFLISISGYVFARRKL